MHRAKRGLRDTPLDPDIGPRWIDSEFNRVLPVRMQKVPADRSIFVTQSETVIELDLASANASEKPVRPAQANSRRKTLLTLGPNETQDPRLRDRKSLNCSRRNVGKYS